MNRWNLKSLIYHRIRSFGPLKYILKKEHDNITRLLNGIQIKLSLDIGCGTGHSILLITSCNNKIGIDKNLNMAKKALKNSNAPIVVADTRFLPFRNKIFDFFTMIGVSEYLENLDILFQELDRTGVPHYFLLITISPPSIFTKLRGMTGHKLYPRNSNFKNDLKNSGYHIVDSQTCYSQVAFLTQRL